MTVSLGARACSIGSHVMVEMPQDVLHGWLEYIGALWVLGRAPAVEYVARYWYQVAEPL